MSASTSQIASNPDVTILVPTFNRPKELRRLLRFLEAMNNSYPVHVLDGGNAESQLLNARLEGEFRGVTVRKYAEGYHFGLRTADGLNHVKTKYIVFCADDDFVIPSGIAACAKFIDDNQEYRAAIGRVYGLGYSHSILRRGVSIMNSLGFSYHLRHASFIERYVRLLAYADVGCPPLYYAVRYADDAREIQNLIPATMKYSAVELINNALTCLMGKAKVLPVDYGFRDYASEPIREEIRADPVYYYSPDDVEHVRSVLLPRLMSKEQLPEAVARAVMDMSVYMPPFISSGNRPAPPIPRWKNIRQRSKRVFHQFLSLYMRSLLSRMTGVDSNVLRALTAAQKELL